MSTRPSRSLRPAALVTVLLTALAAALFSSSPVSADTRPASGVPATVSTDPLPTAQIDGVAWTQLIVGSTVYVGGKFTRARPAGAAAGTSTVVRNNLLAYNVSTGALTSFAPSLNQEANALALSPDGSTLYVGGAFTTVNGITRNRVAAFSTSTGALLSNFAPSANNQVQAIATRGSNVYLGGTFPAIGSPTRPRLAAVSASNGAVVSGF